VLYFDDRTLDRGLAYYDEGHVTDIRAADGALIARVHGTRPQPYTVVLDTEQPEASYCSCPVGVACKHLVAVVATALSDSLPPEEVAWRLEAGVEAEDFRVPEAPTELARQQRVATENPPAADRIIDLEKQVQKSAHFLSTFGSRGRHFFGREGEQAPQSPPQFSDREEETQGRLAFVIGPRYDFHPRIDRERPVVAPVRQYRRKDGAYGRLERLSESTPALATDPNERRLAEHLLLFGGEAPVLAYVDELRQAGSPLFAGDISSLSGAHRSPVSMMEPEHIHADVVPVLSHSPTSRGRGVSLLISLDVRRGDRHLTIGPNEGVWADRGAGRSVLFSDGGTLVLGDGSTLLSEVAAAVQLSGGMPVDAIARLRRLAERFPELVSIRYPQNIHLVSVSPEAVFVLSFAGPRPQLSLGRETDEYEDGYEGEDYHIHLAHADPPEEAIQEASELVKRAPEYDHYSDMWYWAAKDEPAADDAKAADRLLDTALTLAERGFTVYALDTAGRRRRLGKAGPLSVHISSGTDWFDLHVKTSDGSEIDSDLLLEMARRGAYHDGESLVLLDPAEAERLRKILDLTGGPDDEIGGLPAADIASVAELADLADEVDADVEGIRSLVRTIRGEARPPDVPIPAGLTAELRPYQRDGVQWLAMLAAHGLSGCLADDMGLGKTVQALAFMLHLRTAPARAAAAGAARVRAGGDEVREAIPGAVLVVAPLSTLGNWAREATRFAPELTVAVHHGAERAASPEALQSADLVVTSYATAVRDASLFAELSWRLVCLDEAQFIKNPHAKTTKAIKELPADLRLCLTGTPVENLSTDLWSIMDFLVPGLLGNLSQFTRRFPKRLASGGATGNEGGGVGGNESGGGSDGGGAGNDGTARLAHLRRIVSPFLLRRTKEAVAPELPPRTETVLTCEMGSRQARFYATLKAHHRAEVQRAVASGELPRIGAAVFTGLLRLRQAALYPEDADPTGAGIPSVKESELLTQLEEVAAEGHKALVFSQFTSALARLRDAAAGRGMDTLYLDGGTKKRTALLERFQGAEEPLVFFISLKAGGTGINLTAADYVYICDPWWNPQVERQAVDRAHRIGRERPVMVTRLVTNNTVEQKVLDLQEEKRRLAADLIQENQGGLSLASADELVALFE
jgi:superfamily II DNA or RNA helicase